MNGECRDTLSHAPADRGNSGILQETENFKDGIGPDFAFYDLAKAHHTQLTLSDAD
jgi:hypothetical protein